MTKLNDIIALGGFPAGTAGEPPAVQFVSPPSRRLPYRRRLACSAPERNDIIPQYRLTAKGRTAIQI